MKTYTLHVPQGASPGDPEVLDRAELVKEGFSWGAFIFTALWFFVQRLWLAGLIVLVGLFAFGFVLQVLEVTPAAALVAQLLVSFLIGLEANSLKRWTYARRGRPAVAVVTAYDDREAEAKAFTRWLEGREPQPPSTPAKTGMATSYRGVEPVIGLFPEAERPR